MPHSQARPEQLPCQVGPTFEFLEIERSQLLPELKKIFIQNRNSSLESLLEFQAPEGAEHVYPLSSVYGI